MVGTYLVGCANFGGAFLAIFPVQYFGRKTLLFSGHIAMTVSLFMIVVFLVTEMYMALFVCMLVFVVAYHLS
jgi:hypothetical protein